jgi:hypothetical protein
MGIYKSIAAVGLAKQTAKGAPAASPVFGFGVLSGNVFDLEMQQEYEAQTMPGAGGSDRMAAGLNRLSVLPVAKFKCRAFPRSIGAMLFGTLGGNADSGPVSGVYGHVGTPALDVPWWTMWAKYGTGENVLLQDVKFDELTIGWSERAPAEVDVSLIGLVPSLGAAAWWPPTNDETGQAFFGPNAGVFQMNAKTGALVVAKAKGGSVHIANNLDAVPLSKSVLPDDLFPGNQVINGSLLLVPDDLAEWRKVATGTGTGTTVQQGVVYGAGFSLALIMDANNDLTLASAAGRTGFQIPFPAAEPSGGSAEITATFEVTRPSSGDAFTSTLHNQLASY